MPKDQTFDKVSPFKDVHSSKKIRLGKPQWELIAQLISVEGEIQRRAYLIAYPGNRNPQAAFYRLCRHHPEVRDRILQIKESIEAHEKNSGALERGDILEMLFDNIESAKGKEFEVVTKWDEDGRPTVTEKLQLKRNHTSINASIKIMAEVSGFLAKGRRRDEGEEDQTGSSPRIQDVLREVMAKATILKGRELTDDERAAFRGLAGLTGPKAEPGFNSEESA